MDNLKTLDGQTKAFLESLILKLDYYKLTPADLLQFEKTLKEDKKEVEKELGDKLDLEEAKEIKSHKTKKS